MSKVSKLCEFSPKVRKIIKERDSNSCVIPNCYRGYLGIAHIFYPRSKGGLGKKENGVLLCQHHHHLLDNGRDSKIAHMIQTHCESYLRSHYDIDTRELRFDKWKNFKIK